VTKEIYDKATELLKDISYFEEEISKYKRRKFFSAGLGKSVIELLADAKQEDEEKYLRMFEEALQEKRKEFEEL
jgi:hypothetical protein